MAESTPSTPKPAAAKKPAATAKLKTNGTVKSRADAQQSAATPKPGREARARFSAAIDEARSGAAALAKDAQARSDQYREKLSVASSDWLDEARTMSEQAKDRAAALAKDGKTRASDAISGLGKVVADTAGTIDEKLGARYGDYARTAARTMQETAARIEAKDVAELGEDARQFVRKSPGAAIGIAAVLGFFVARLFRGGRNDT